MHLDPLLDANPELARWRMTNEVIAHDGGARRETADIAFRRSDPARFADMLQVAGFRDITLMDETGTGPIRENEEAYLVLARTGYGPRQDRSDGDDRRHYTPGVVAGRHDLFLRAFFPVLIAHQPIDGAPHQQLAARNKQDEPADQG